MCSSAWSHTADDTGDKPSSSSPVPLQVLCTLFAEYFASFDRSTCALPVSCHVALPCQRYTRRLGLQFQTALHEGAADNQHPVKTRRDRDRPFTFPWASFQITFSCSAWNPYLDSGSVLPNRAGKHWRQEPLAEDGIPNSTCGKQALPRTPLIDPALCCHRESNPILPVHSPLLRQSSLLAFPLLTDMLKFSRSFAIPSG